MPSYPDLSSLGDFIGTGTPITINGPFPGIGIITSATSISTLPNGTDGQHLVISAGVPTWVTETTTFSFVGQSGSTETVDHGDTITFSSSNLIKTTSAATRVLDIQLDTTSANLGDVVIFNGTNAVWGTSTGESTTVSDTNSIDLTITGTDITADLKISATTPNLATVAVDGLLVQETITTLTDNLDGTYTYVSEDGTSTTIGDGSIVTYVDAVTGTTHKIGDLFDQTGTPTVVNETVTSYSDVSGTPNINIGAFTHEDGSVSLINESLTSMTQSLVTGDITYVSEDASASPVVAKVVSTDADNSITVGTDGGAYYNAPALVNGATWNDTTNTIEITFDDLSVVNVPIVDNVASFLSDFTITDGTTTSLINNHDTVSFISGNGITQVVTPNTLTTSVKLSTDAGNNVSFGTDGGIMLDVSSVLPIETEEYFDAVSGTTVVLTNTPAISTIVQVMKNGQVLRNGATRDYTISGSTITFNVTLASDDIHVIYKY